MRTIPVVIQRNNGQISALVAGAPTLHASANTKEEAVAILMAQVREEHAKGDLLLVPLDLDSYQESPYTAEAEELIRESVREQYAYRDQLKKEEWPE